MRARTRWLTAVGLAAAVVTGCGDASTPVTSADPGAKLGGKPAPIAITVADSQFSDRPSNLPLAEFKRQVEALSNGSMTVTILTNASPDGNPPNSDTPIIDKVKSGAFQMAVVPARAWSAAGVTSMKPLQAPLLVESDEHMAAIVNDADLVADLFSGFEGSGVTGLALFPESLRHIFSFGDPILRPDDVEGQTIRAISSLETKALIEALGGTAVDPSDAEFQQGVRDRTITAADAGYPLSAGAPLGTAIATGNLVLYPKMITLVINSQFWTGLDDAQREIITTASNATRAWAIAHQMSDAEAAAAFCTRGGTVVLADGSSLTAFRSAESPVISALEADPATKRAMATIRELAAGTSPEPVKACHPVFDASTLVPDGGDMPNGIYRVEYPDEYLKSWGLNLSDANYNHGLWTYRLEDGHWTIDQKADDITSQVQGIYRVVDHDLYWRWDNDPGDPVEHLTWSVDSRGDLTFEPAPGGEEGWTFAKPLSWVSALD